MGNMDKGLSTFFLSWQGYKSIMMPERGKPRVPESLDGSMNFSVKAFIVNFDKGPIWDHSRILITYSVVFENPGPQGFAEITLHSKQKLVLLTWMVCFVLDFTANSNFSYLFLVLKYSSMTPKSDKYKLHILSYDISLHSGIDVSGWFRHAYKYSEPHYWSHCPHTRALCM